MLRQLALFFNLTTIFLGTASALPPQPLHVKVVPGSVKSGTFEVGKGAGKVPVEARELEVQIELSNRYRCFTILVLSCSGGVLTRQKLSLLAASLACLRCSLTTASFV
jgi:hypothetical protein